MGRGDRGAEGMAHQHIISSQVQLLGQPGHQPRIEIHGVLHAAAGSTANRWGLPKAGQVWDQHLVVGQRVDDQLHTVVITAEPVDHQQPRPPRRLVSRIAGGGVAPQGHLGVQTRPAGTGAEEAESEREAAAFTHPVRIPHPGCGSGRRLRRRRAGVLRVHTAQSRSSGAGLPRHTTGASPVRFWALCHRKMGRQRPESSTGCSGGAQEGLVAERAGGVLT